MLIVGGEYPRRIERHKVRGIGNDLELVGERYVSSVKADECHCGKRGGGPRGENGCGF